MSNINTIFTRIALASIKKDFRDAGLKVPVLTTIRYKSGNNLQFDVWRRDIGSCGFFSAYDAADAKYQYLSRLLRKLKPEPTEVAHLS